MYLIPCSCGLTFSVSASYDKQGTSISRYIPCPRCGKRHDPKNRLLQMGYEARRFWTIKDC
jgi:hydrogenase maturation factor HypF (carbamoyltransferase family)